MKFLLRRDFLKGLVSLPFLGYFTLFFKKKVKTDLMKDKKYIQELGIEDIRIPGSRIISSPIDGSNLIRVGLVGYGWRGRELLKAIGYAHPSWTKNNTKDGKYSVQLQQYLQQDDLNVEIAGICDLFSVRAEQGVEAALNPIRPPSVSRPVNQAKIYPTYREMINDKDIDALIIATPDHWHAQMIIDAVKAGKHVYCEKPMTLNIEEAVEVKNTVKSTGISFQLGHQNRQQMSYKMAKELIKKNLLGTISLIETYTNRNSDRGAWIRGIDDQGSLDTINWKEFLGAAPWIDFDPDRYFNWQKWFEYSGGVSGNQFTHAYDCVNQVLGLGIPESVVATGGLYHFKDARNIPDVFNAVFNYPGRKLILTYDCTLINSRYRNTFFMGSDATMEIGSGLTIYKDSNSKRYQTVQIDPKMPLYSYHSNPKVDAVSSATSKAYHWSGFVDTVVDGVTYDLTYLHLKEWLDSIRGLNTPSCDIEAGFEESVTYIMSNLAFLKNKAVQWDTRNEKIRYC